LERIIIKIEYIICLFKYIKTTLIVAMNKEQKLYILNKYKDSLPFDYAEFYNDFMNGNIDALIYVSHLIKHDNDIAVRDCCYKPRIRTSYPGEKIDDNLLYNRMNFIRISDTSTYFDGWY
jgi:hypothetical protein